MKKSSKVIPSVIERIKCLNAISLIAFFVPEECKTLLNEIGPKLKPSEFVNMWNIVNVVL